jgi:FMN reductase
MTALVAIVGSATAPGRLRRAVAEALARAAPEAELFDLAEYPLPFAGAGPVHSRVLDAVAAADAVLLASPVYRGTYTGVLKNLLDLLPVEALQGKPVGIVAMGATDHHSLGVDWQLRGVLAWFGAATLPVNVYLNSRDFSDGAPGARAAEQLDSLTAALTAFADASPRLVGPPPLAASGGSSNGR